MSARPPLDLSLLDGGWEGGAREDPIPSSWERRLLELLDLAERNDQLGAVLARVRGPTWGVLIGSSEAIASLAVRQRDPRLLELAVITWCLGWPGALDFDSREAMPALAVLWRAAELLQPNAGSFFRDMAGRVPAGGDQLISFADRHPGDRTLNIMGRAEGEDLEGFRFIWATPHPNLPEPMKSDGHT
jgi:hypothetical protein